ncbi:MAG TPA: type II toxin-antitoxin system VapC family toxin [Rhodocyclaceae bacterium]|nr:type II toxin-antitoxin system VapC family toxin [Rhodocyclaceae bacterium]
MNLLLDTHVALWAITGHAKLTPAARELIETPRNTIWVSAVSLWEIAIKHALGRGDMPVSSQDALRYFRQAGYRILAMEPEHAVATESLPPHHHDPFDRLLIAQALTEPMRLMTHDETVARYSDAILLV